MNFILFFLISVPVKHVDGVVAKTTHLPCDITPSESDDAVYMVLWFKDGDGEPLYRYARLFFSNNHETFFFFF